VSDTRAPDCPAGHVVYGRPCEGPATYYCDELLCGPIYDRRHAGEETPAERVARRFHEAYERLAPEFGYTTRQASRTSWAKVPERNRRLMIAVAQELLDAAESDALDGAR
jgi:hypothetical protein